MSEVTGAGFADLQPVVPDGDRDEPPSSYAERLRLSVRARATAVAAEHQDLQLELDRLRAKASGTERD